jgi:HAD superfamily hydrolase (TIGR01509 family)
MKNLTKIPAGTRAVVFDMDGVLLDSEPIHFDALNEMLATHGHAVGLEDNEHLLGITVDESFQWLATRFNLDGPIERYMREYDERILVRLDRPLDPSPGVLDLLANLKRRNIPLALASSSRTAWITATLASLGIRDYFSVVVSGDDVERGKPEPDIYLMASELLGVLPDHCLVIEDSPAGMLAGARAGMKVVGVRTPYTTHLDLGPADFIVDSLEDLQVDGVAPSKCEPARDLPHS